MLICRWPL